MKSRPEPEAVAPNSQVWKTPLGVSFIIAPFNFPFWQLVKPAVAHFIVGNPVIVKPAHSTSLCALLIEELMREAGIEAAEY